MKVLHLTDAPDLIGGVQTYLADLCRMAGPVGLSCEVWRPPGTHRQATSHVTRWFGQRYERELSSRLAYDTPSIVHAHNLWMRLSPLPLRAAKAAGVPVVMTVHDYHLVCPRKWMITAEDHPCESAFGTRCLHADCRGSKEGWAWLPYNQGRWLKIALHRQMLRAWVDVFVAPSDHLGTWIRRSLGVERVIHLPNFACRPLQSSVQPGEAHRLLFAGRLSREKGVDVLVRAMPAVLEKQQKTRLTIAGDGPERASLERLATTLGLGDAVAFAGAVAGGELDELYRSAGICLLPTLWMENCPVAILEAMAHGRAVVATRIGGIPELVRDGMTGLLVERGDHRELAGALLALLAAPATVAAMGRHASQAYAARYTPEIHLDRLLAVYRGLTEATEPPPCSAAR